MATAMSMWQVTVSCRFTKGQKLATLCQSSASQQTGSPYNKEYIVRYELSNQCNQEKTIDFAALLESHFSRKESVASTSAIIHANILHKVEKMIEMVAAFVALLSGG